MVADRCSSSTREPPVRRFDQVTNRDSQMLRVRVTRDEYKRIQARTGEQGDERRRVHASRGAPTACMASQGHCYRGGARSEPAPHG